MNSFHRFILGMRDSHMVTHEYNSGFLKSCVISGSAGGWSTGISVGII